MIFPFLISRENLYQIAPQYLSLIEMINVFRDHLLELYTLLL